MKDEELGLLLRETFADKEELVDTLPVATTRRKTPILLAAASVLVVLGGILYAVGGSDPKPGPLGGTVPGATTSTTVTVPTAPGTAASTVAPPPVDPSAEYLPENAEIWAAATVEILKIERPAAGWPGVNIVDRPNAGAGSPNETYELAKPLTEAERKGIENELAKIAPVTWVPHQPVGENVCDQPASEKPYVTLGPIQRVQGHAEVGINVWRGCLDAHWLTYRLDQKLGSWKITGTVGPQAVS